MSSWRTAKCRNSLASTCLSDFPKLGSGSPLGTVASLHCAVLGPRDSEALYGAAKDTAQGHVSSPCSHAELARPWPLPPLCSEQQRVELLFLCLPFL